MKIEVRSEDDTKSFGQRLGKLLRGGEIIELTGDVGAGKTTLVKGIALGLGIDQYIQSPSFTINRIYKGRDGISLSHYDFYRLDDAGIMADELTESLEDQKYATVIEWGGVVDGALPIDRITIHITATSENARTLELNYSGPKSQKFIEGLLK